MAQSSMNKKKEIDTASVSRRGFVKGSALVGLAAGATSFGLVGCAPTAKDLSETTDAVSTAGYQYASETAEGEWHHSACQRNCFDTCMIMSKVVDGQLVQVRGDENNPYTAGGLCVKTQNYVDWCYSEDRILYPLKRTGTKGPGCTFERISWDEAIDTITSKWKEIIDSYGGEAITWSRYQGNQGSLNRRVIEPVFFKMGATYHEGTMCNNSYVFSLPYTTGTVPVMRAEDIANKDLYISWSHNPATASLHTMKFIKDMHKKGGKIVVINPIATPETMWADLHIQIRPGSDVAFALGVAKYLIDHDLFDQTFIDTYSIGFEDYKVAADEWPQERVAETCGIPAEQVEQFAQMLWEDRANACFKIGLQLGRRNNGGMSHISAKSLTGLIGHPECYFNMTTSGGFNTNTTAMQETMFEGKIPSEADPSSTVRNFTSSALGKALTGENYGEGHNFADNPLRSLMIFGNNPLVSNPNQNLVEKGLKREDLFTIVHEMFMTPSCDFADIILPAPSSFEYEEFNGGYGHNYDVFNEKIIEPLGECVPNWELCNMLGQAMGFDDPAFSRTPESFQELFLEDRPYTYEDFVKEGWFYVEPNSWDSVYESGFPTPSKKFQFSSDELEHDHGSRAAAYIPDPESLAGDSSLVDKYPLAVLTPSAKEYLNGCFGNMPDNNILFHENYVYMNTEDASERGISDGDQVVVHNDRGELQRIARVIEKLVAPRTVYTYKSTWSTFSGVENANRITSDSQADIGRGTTFMSCLAEIKKA